MGLTRRPPNGTLRVAVSASVAAVYLGFALMTGGVYLLAGAGWSCLFAGALLFIGGNLSERR
jgi:hypothetical protein